MSRDELRREIDKIDASIVRLLCDRVNAAIQIGEEKRKTNTPALDPTREHEVLARVKSLKDGPLSDDAIETIYRQIITACRQMQSPDSD